MGRGESPPKELFLISSDGRQIVGKRWQIGRRRPNFFVKSETRLWQKLTGCEHGQKQPQRSVVVVSHLCGVDGN